MNQRFREHFAKLHKEFDSEQMLNAYAPTFYESLISNDLLKFKEAIDEANNELALGIKQQVWLVVEFLEELYNDSSFSKQLLLSYWIFYLYVWAKPLDNPQEIKLLKKINDLIEEHKQLLDVFSSIIKIWKIDPQQQEWLMNTVKSSAIYKPAVQLLTVDDSLSEQKIREIHEDLLYIMKEMETYKYIAEAELHRHILIQFEIKYKRQTQLRKKAEADLMDIRQIQEKLITKNKAKTKQAFSELLRPSCGDRLLQLQIIKSELVNFDNFLLKRLIELSSEKFQDKQMNKNLIFLVGPSGSGKTTIMLRLLGYDLEVTKIKGLKTLAPKGLRPEHRPLHTSPETNSITRYLFSQKIPKNYLPLGNDQIYYLCDTPGLEDSAGPEVDASNMISIVKAVAACRLIKIVIVVSQRKIGDRFDGIKKIAKIISNMITDFKSLEKAKAIEFIFNKFDNEDDLNRLPAGISDILNNLSPLQSSNQSYKQFLTHFLKKMSNKKALNIKFQPNINIQQTIQALNLQKMTDSTKNFQNSWSDETKNAIKLRQATLARYIKEYLGQDNNKAFYYLKELQVMSQCLDHDYELRNNLLEIKNSIKLKAQSKYDTFCKILTEEIEENNANNSTYSTIEKYSREIRQYEIFFPIIDDLVTTAQITSKIDEVKKKQKEIIQNLYCPFGEQQYVFKKVMGIFKFIEKISPSEVEDLFQTISLSLNQKKKILKQFIRSKSLKDIKDSFESTIFILNLLFRLTNQLSFKKSIDILKIDIQAERTSIEQQVIDCFDKFVTNVKCILLKTEKGQQITKQNISSIKNIIKQFQQQQFNSSSDKINSKAVKNSIKSLIQSCIVELIQKTLYLLSTVDLSQSKIGQIKIYRSNIDKIHSIFEEEMSNPQVEIVVKKLKQFINSSKQKFLDFIQKLKQDKAITKKNLKIFNRSYQIILKLEEDEKLEKQICKLKQSMRNIIQKHIRQLQQKSGKVKISLKLKKSITHENLIDIEKIFYEAEAFYKTKQFKRPQYFSIKSDVTRSKPHIEGQQSSESEQQQLNIGQISQKIFKDLIKKLLKPYQQISQQVKKMKVGGSKCLNSKYIKELQSFQNYRCYLQSKDISFCPQFQEQKNEIEKQHNYKEILTDLLQEIKKKIQLLHDVNYKQANFIDSDKFNEITDLKRVIVFLIDSSHHEQVNQLFLECQFNISQIIDIFENVIKNTFTIFCFELSESKKQDKITNIKRLKSLKQKIESIKFYDTIFKDNRYNQTTVSFETLITDTSKYIDKIQDMKASQVNSLFKDSEIIIKDIRQAYQLYTNDERDGERNQENIRQLYDNLKEYGKKTLSNLMREKKNYLKEEPMTIEGSFAFQYILALEKSFRLYEQISEFIKNQQFLTNFALRPQFFKDQLKEIKMEQKLDQTLEAIQQKICNFDYKGKEKEFDKIIQTIKKIEYLQKTLALSEQNNPYSDRLKETKTKIDNQFSLKQSDGINIQNFIAKDKFVNFYIKLDKNSAQKKKIDSKIDQNMTNLFQQYHKYVNKPESQISTFEDKIKDTFTKLPQDMRPIYRQQFKTQKIKIQQKTKAELKNITKEFEGPSLQNLRKLSSKIKESNKEAVQKQGISVFEKNIKQIERQILQFDNNKRLNLVKCFRRYIFYFGPQNQSIINQIISTNKTKQLFESLQKHILTQFAQQLKDLIRQLMQLMNKFYEQISKQFDDKCERINQFYALILENITAESQNKKFSICIYQWKKCIYFINDKLRAIKSQCKDLSFKKNDYSVRKLQKTLSDVKMCQIFQESLTQSTINLKKEEIPESQEQALLLRSLLKDQTRQSFTIILNQEISSLINSIQKVTFFDDLIKVYSTSTLQLQFQNNVIKNLKILKQIQQLNKKCLFNQALAGINSQHLIKQTQQKWQRQLRQCLEEFRESLSQEKLEVSQKITTFYRLAIIFQRKQWAVIDRNLNSYQKIQQCFKQNFDLIQKNLESHYRFIENQISNKNELNISYNLKKNRMLKQIQQWKTELEQFRRRINFKIDNSSTLETKQKLVLQLSNAELLHRQKVQKTRIQLGRQYQLMIKKNQDSLEKYISTKTLQDLISMKKYSQSVTSKAKQSNNIIENFINIICKYDKKINRYLYSALSNSSSPYALMIGSDGLFFRAQAAEKFKVKTHKQDLNYIINNCPSLKDNKNLRSSIQRAFSFYHCEYEKNINTYKDSPRKEFVDTIVHSLMEHKSRSQASKLQPAQVIAKIFSIWSIINADMSDPDNPQIDFQPHPAQIVSILLLIGFDESISNKLIEVKTGEGKSIVLAGLCCYLALSGFKAYCACYSEYLSKRDERLFKDLFDYLGVRENISYGTFGEHCQSIINQIGSNNYEKSTFRDNIKQLIMEIQPKNQQKLKQQFSKLDKDKNVNNINKILIIDQADVFFNKNFFGQLYIPSITFQGPEVKQVIEKIWRITQPSRQNSIIQRITKQQVMQTQQVTNFLMKYSSIQSLMENQLIGMIEACYNYKHSYTIHQDSIKYLENDNITDKISYGYKTVFANCFQYQRKNICESAYNTSLNISIKIGEFSYSQLPKFFRNILGVSGTLSSMSDFKLPLLKDKYSICDLYIIPSIYGESKRTNDIYTLVQDDSLYDKIVQTVKKIIETNRPVIIFFNSIQDIIAFYKSPQFKELMDRSTILSEETDHESRDIIIKRVGYNHTITISTNSFSRGTDFQVFDEKTKEAGGLCVIQTTIPSDFSQFIQVRGRSARQGEKGSFQMIICDKELQKFNINCKENTKFYNKMLDAWKKIQITECENLRKKVEERKIRHDDTFSLLSTGFSRENVVNYIYNHNMYASTRINKVRTLIGIDGTSSMGAALQMVKSIVSESFIRTKQVLGQKQIKGSFENQIAFYRNYNSDHKKLLEYSPFETESEKLGQFLKNISIEGGFGNEAVEVLFQHANSLNQLDQIILIADARANFLKQIPIKRGKGFGNQYWIENGFPQTDSQSQLLRLLEKKIKIHTLYIYLDSSPQVKRQQLKDYCEQISSRSSGISSQFKINDNNASSFLTGFFVKNILLQIGGQEKGRELVENYDLKYGAVPMRI